MGDMFVTLYNFAATLGYFFIFLRYFILAVSVVWVFLAILNLWSLSSAAANGQLQKLFPTRAEPTTTSAWFQVFLAGATFILGLEMLPASMLSAILTGSTEAVQVYTVGSYTPGNHNDQFTTYTKAIVFGFFALIALFAYFRAFKTLWDLSNGTSRKTLSHVIGYFFFGTLCFKLDWLNALIVSIIGFDFFATLFAN